MLGFMKNRFLDLSEKLSVEQVDDEVNNEAEEAEKAEEEALKSRLLLSHLAGEVLKKGLDLLGIKVVNKM